MFTGLVRDLGKIVGIEDWNGVKRFTVEGNLAAEDLTIGASVSHSGVCLTVVSVSFDQAKPRWVVEAVPETLSLTTLGAKSVGDAINLEPSLRLGDELGGHLVFGHVDGLGQIVGIDPEGDSYRVTVSAPEALMPLMAHKGSICIDGISLTVAAIGPENSFQIAVIPHTWQVTSLGQAVVGQNVNLEIDMLARYVARQLECSHNQD